MIETLLAVRYKDSKHISVAALTVSVWLEGEIWIAECLELGTSTYASTLEDVRKELSEAVTLQLREMESLGFIEEFLRDHHVRLFRIDQPPSSSRRGSSWVTPTLASV